MNGRKWFGARRPLDNCVAVLLLVFAAASVHAAIVIVPTDQPTIQQGIDAASVGDTVLVEDGIYLENVKIFSKKLHLASRYILDGNAQHILKTIIDGSSPASTDSGSCVVVSGVSGGVIEGFTLTRGIGTKWFDPSDGNIYREGGGILTDGGSVTIRHNFIMNNRATIQDATASGGGGIRTGFGTATIEANVIAYNQAYYGAAVVFFHAAGTIKNNVVWRNSGGQAFGGGGLWIWNCTDPVFLNNTIIENASATTGGGISTRNVDVVSYNNIVRSNTSPTGPQFSATGQGGITVEYSDVQGGFAGTGNLDRLPIWADSNFILSATSPCVDSGDALNVDRDVADLGDPSLAKFPSRGSRRNDMGAYGGPHAVEFPLFTSPRVGLDISSIDFGADTTTHISTAQIPLHKIGWGLLSVDSIGTGAGNGIASVTALPHSVPVSFADTLTIQWSRPNAGTLVDTARIYHNDTSVVSPLLVSLTGVAIQGSCCAGVTGNVDCDPSEGTDIADLSALIDYLYITFTPLCCDKEANTDGSPDGNIDIADLSSLIDYLYISFTPTSGCL